MSAQQDGAKSTNWIEQIAPTLSRIDNKDNNKDNIKERKKKESIRHNIHCAKYKLYKNHQGFLLKRKP